MPSTSIVSAVSEGAARSYDIHHSNLGSSQTAAAQRDGIFLDAGNPIIFGTNNLGLGAAGVTQVVRNGASCYKQTGASGINPVYGWVCDRPARRFAWPIGRMIVECFMCWDNNVVVGNENGLFCTQVDYTLPVSGVGEGLGVYNDGGVIKYISRSNAAGAEIIPLQVAGSLTAWNKFSWMFQNATADQDAAVTLFVNDQPVVRRTNATLGFTGVFWFLPYVGIRDAVQGINWFQLGLWMGPDTDIGM